MPQHYYGLHGIMPPMASYPWTAQIPELGEVVRIAVTLLLAALSGEILHRYVKIPRVTGYVLVGLLLGPAGLGLVRQINLDHDKVLLDLATTLILFELGTQVSLRWLRNNLWLIASSLLEATLTFAMTFFALHLLGFEAKLSLTLSTLVVATSPAIVLCVTSEWHSQGQITQRLRVMSILSTAYAAIGSKLALGGLHVAIGSNWGLALLQPLYLLGGSLIVGASLALTFKYLRHHLDFTSPQGGAALFGLLLLSISLLGTLSLPMILAPMVGGILTKHWDPRPHLWPKYFGTAGTILFILMFALTGTVLSWHDIIIGGKIALLLAGIRFLSKFTGVLAFGFPSGLSLKQAMALGYALTPLSVETLLLVQDISTTYPSFGDHVSTILFPLIVILGLIGPIALQYSLRSMAEVPDELP